MMTHGKKVVEFVLFILANLTKGFISVGPLYLNIKTSLEMQRRVTDFGNRRTHFSPFGPFVFSFLGSVGTITSNLYSVL